jgi:hypothetical protein
LLRSLRAFFNVQREDALGRVLALYPARGRPVVLTPCHFERRAHSGIAIALCPLPRPARNSELTTAAAPAPPVANRCRQGRDRRLHVGWLHGRLAQAESISFTRETRQFCLVSAACDVRFGAVIGPFLRRAPLPISANRRHSVVYSITSSTRGSSCDGTSAPKCPRVTRKGTTALTFTAAVDSCSTTRSTGASNSYLN